MHYLVTLIGGWLAARMTRTGILVFINGLALVAHVSVFAFFISAIVQFHNIVTDFIALIGSGSGIGNSLLDKFFGLLRCIGFVDALYASMPLITSSLVMLFSSVFYSLSFKFYSRFRVLLVDIVK